MRKIDNIKIVSPLEIKHYVLDIPIIKSQYQANAVKFALRALYPGNDDNTTTDYAYTGKKVIGIATNKEKITQQQIKTKFLLSPTLIAYYLTKNGIAVSISDNWFELLLIKNRAICNIYSFTSSQLEILNEKFIEISNNNPDLFIYIFNFNSNESDFSNLFTTLSQKKKEQINIININDKLTPSLVKKCTIFCKKSSKRNFITIGLFLFIFSFLSILDFVYYEKAKIKKQNLSIIRNEYNDLKRNIIEIPKISTTTEKPKIPNRISVEDLLCEISKSSNTIRLLSLTISDNTLRFEAEKANALEVLENLINSELLEEVILHQSIPQEDGSEQFTISGRIKND